MKSKFIASFILLFLFCNFCFSQNWIPLDKPQSGILGKLIIGNNLTGNRIDTSLIQTETGSNEYVQQANHHFTVNLKITGVDLLKYSDAKIDTMSVDYLSDKALYQNAKYFTNPFVYKALRAKSVTLKFKKTSDFKIVPKEILGKISEKIASVIPLFDSLKVTYNSKDTLYVKIMNPKVYFEAVAITLNPNYCDQCRVSFATSFNEDGASFNMDLAKTDRSFSTVSVMEGTNPVFKLDIGQDDKDEKKLTLQLEMDQAFCAANNLDIDKPIAIPFKDIKLGGKTIRRFGFPTPHYYIGSITTTPPHLLSAAVTLNIPVFISISGEQISDTEIKFVNKDLSGKYMTKLEYPEYSYKVYSGKIY